MISQFAEDSRQTTLPRINRVLDNLANSKHIDETLKEIKALREETSKSTRELLKILQNCIITIKQIPHFLKAFTMMTLTCCTAYTSIRHLIIPGVNKIIKVYNKAKPQLELKNIALLQTTIGILATIFSTKIFSDNWNSFKAKEQIDQENRI